MLNEKANSKGYIVHDFIYVIFTNNCKDGDRLVVARLWGWGRGDGCGHK